MSAGSEPPDRRSAGLDAARLHPHLGTCERSDASAEELAVALATLQAAHEDHQAQPDLRLTSGLRLQMAAAARKAAAQFNDAEALVALKRTDPRAWGNTSITYPTQAQLKRQAVMLQFDLLMGLIDDLAAQPEDAQLRQTVAAAAAGLRKEQGVAQAYLRLRSALRPHLSGLEGVPVEILHAILSLVPVEEWVDTFESFGATSKGLRSKTSVFWALSLTLGLGEVLAKDLSSGPLLRLLDRVAALPDDTLPPLAGFNSSVFSTRSMMLDRFVDQVIGWNPHAIDTVVPVILDRIQPGEPLALPPRIGNRLLELIAMRWHTSSEDRTQVRAGLLMILQRLDLAEKGSAAGAVWQVAPAFVEAPWEFLAAFEQLQARGWRQPPPESIADDMVQISAEERWPVFQDLARAYAAADAVSVGDCLGDASPRIEHPLGRALEFIEATPAALALARRESRRIPDANVRCCALASIERLAIPRLDRDLQEAAFAGIVKEMSSGLRQYDDQPDESVAHERQRAQRAIDDLWLVYVDCPGIARKSHIALLPLQARLPPIVA